MCEPGRLEYVICCSNALLIMIIFLRTSRFCLLFSTVWHWLNIFKVTGLFSSGNTPVLL